MIIEREYIRNSQATHQRKGNTITKTYLLICKLIKIEKSRHFVGNVRPQDLQGG
ncbi:MAG TPA: hypothetical protein VHU84_12785 [Lacipirellulaceae bacterium]|nr:hypothetical protein [Lacipirellulaceae bacterium]